MKRIVTAAVIVAAALAGSAHASDELAKKHNCLACHTMDKKSVGPAYKDVAKKYKGDAAAAARLAEKVKQGGQGVWGPVPMPPNSTVPDGDIKTLVDWILKSA